MLVGLVEEAGSYPLPESPFVDVVEVVVIIAVAAEPSKESPVSSK